MSFFIVTTACYDAAESFAVSASEKDTDDAGDGCPVLDPCCGERPLNTVFLPHEIPALPTLQIP
jgi:hypothetical protein